MNLADYLLTERKLELYYKTSVSRERVTSFRNRIFVPDDLEITLTVEGSCLQNFKSVSKLHLIYFIKKSTIMYK